MIRWNGKTLRQTGCHRFVCFSCMHVYNLRCYVNRLQFSRSPTPFLLARGSFETMARFVSPEGFPADEFAALETGNRGPHTVESGHGVQACSCLSILDAVVTSRNRKKGRRKKRRKETINACVSVGRYKLDSWRVERIEYFAGRAFYFAPTKRNSTRLGIILCRHCSFLRRGPNIIEIFRFGKLA